MSAYAPQNAAEAALVAVWPELEPKLIARAERKFAMSPWRHEARERAEEKAQDALGPNAGGKRPTSEQVAAALKGLTFEGPGGQVRMAIGDGHQAIMETAYGQTKMQGGKLTVVNVKRYPAEKVNPPEGIKSADWIKNGFKK